MRACSSSSSSISGSGSVSRLTRPDSAQVVQPLHVQRLHTAAPAQCLVASGSSNSSAHYQALPRRLTHKGVRLPDVIRPRGTFVTVTCDDHMHFMRGHSGRRF